MYRILLLILIGLAPATVSADQGKNLLNKFLSEADSLSAIFTQTLYASDGTEMQVSKGEFYLKRPGMFRWNYKKPYLQEIISDGERLWMYDVELQQVTVQNKETSMRQSPMQLLDNRELFEKSYKTRELTKENNLYMVELIRKNNDGDFKKVIVGLDETGLRQMQLYDQFEQTTVIELTELQINKKLEDALFKFIPPEGVDVFGNR